MSTAMRPRVQRKRRWGVFLATMLAGPGISIAMASSASARVGVAPEYPPTDREAEASLSHDCATGVTRVDFSFTAPSGPAGVTADVSLVGEVNGDPFEINFVPGDTAPGEYFSEEDTDFADGTVIDFHLVVEYSDGDVLTTETSRFVVDCAAVGGGGGSAPPPVLPATR